MFTARTGALRRLTRRCARSEDGAVAPLIGLLLLVMIGSAGMAIDVGRSMLVRAKLVDALDAAGLAVGARIGTTDFSGDALRFVNANFKANYAQATITNVTATPNASNTVIALTATATVPTAFMKIFGSNSVTVTATSEVTRASSGVEIVLVLDNTGSMDDSGSMPTLKSSANDLVDILFGNQSTAQNLYVGLVPFSSTVNVGPSHTNWINPADSQVDFPASWAGCVEARLNGLDQDDTPPNTTTKKNLFDYYYFPYIQNNYISYSDYRKYKLMNIFCPQPMTLMTNQKSKVTSAINAMTAAGNTHINLGAVWGWRLLSPSWRGVWDGDMTSLKLPLDYNTKNMSKALVLMTDGDNTMNNGVYTAYGQLSDGRLGTTNSESAASDELDKRLAKVCASMKSKGVIVYTVAFNNPNATTKTLLQNCATNGAFYFDAGDKASLSVAFKTIGSSLSALRVSK